MASITYSALDDLDSIVDCINLGANDYITKPIDISKEQLEKA